MGKTKRIRKIGRKITDGAARVVTWHDNGQARFDRFVLILQYRLAYFIHTKRKSLSEHKKSILGHFAGFLLAAIALVAVFNYATGFQYAYNGKVLGYVKNQEDVVKVLDLVSEGLSQEYGSRVEIDVRDNISFKNVFVLDKEIDDIDTVLKRFTYLSDMEAQACCIFIDGKPFVNCESEEAAKYVLKSIQQKFMDDEDRDVEYEKVSFKEEVDLRTVETRLTDISSVKAARELILTGGSRELTYEVQPGDTYYEIAEQYDTTVEELSKINPEMDVEALYPGDEITINKAVSALTVITVEKTTYAEKVKYKTETRKDKTMYENDSRVIQKGADGKQVVTARITRENGEVISKDVMETEVIQKPVKKIVVKGTKKLPKTAPTGTFIMPVSGYTLTSEFGWRWGRNHDGLDLACGTGTPIHAADGGTVVYAGWYSGYGLFIEIDHGGGIHSRYGHCNSIDVSRGDKVYQGQKIGEVGNTGNSYGSHCHFEITVNGTPVDPFKYL